MTKLKFGTDGWRAIMCEDFTFPNARRVVAGICRYIKESGLAERGLVIGYDTRFFSLQFAQTSAQVCAAQGIKVFMSSADVPTPVVAFSIKARHAAGAIMFTASHNPPLYNGIKFIPQYAGPAMPDITDKIEAYIAPPDSDIPLLSLEEAQARQLLQYFDPAPEYLEQVQSLIDLETISKAKLKIVYDPLYATGRNYVPAILSHISDLITIHNNPDPYFGGITPEPLGRNLADLVDKVSQQCHLGLATDGDADRFGVVDFDGTYINANEVIALLLWHLTKNRQLQGTVARTVATTHMIDKIALSFGLKVMETPVGFKYIGKIMREEHGLLGGEESGGLTIQGHIPEKDGVLAVCLIAELRAKENKSLGVLLDDLRKRFGNFHSKRIDCHIEEAKKVKLLEQLRQNPPVSLAGLKVKEVNTIDGVKLYLEREAWALFRASGTEPLVRIYIEALEAETLANLEIAVTEILGQA